MRVRCVGNRGEALTALYEDPATGYGSDARFQLTVGCDYVVYGVVFRRQQLWYYIADDAFVDSPRRYPHCIFEVVDAGLSAAWRLAIYDETEHTYILAPQEWVRDEFLVDKMISGDESAVAIFLQEKALMDAEDARRRLNA